MLLCYLRSTLVDTDTASQLSDDNIFIGFVTRQTLLKLEREGDCSPSDSRKFLLGVRQFYVAAVAYINTRFPIGDEVLTHARFINFDKREECGFSDVEYFIERYHGFLCLSAGDSDEIFDEFVSYQLLKKEDIPKDVWDSAVEESESSSGKQSFVRMDVIWAYLSALKTGDGCDHRFALLSRVAKLVLVLPHSNAGEERVFSLVRLNKTPYRSSLNLEGTLSSILTVKLHNPEPCYQFEPSDKMLENSRKVTWEYNKEHSTNK